MEKSKCPIKTGTFWKDWFKTITCTASLESMTTSAPKSYVNLDFIAWARGRGFGGPWLRAAEVLSNPKRRQPTFTQISRPLYSVNSRERRWSVLKLLRLLKWWKKRMIIFWSLCSMNRLDLSTNVMFLAWSTWLLNHYYGQERSELRLPKKVFRSKKLLFKLFFPSTAKWKGLYQVTFREFTK